MPCRERRQAFLSGGLMLRWIGQIGNGWSVIGQMTAEHRSATTQRSIARYKSSWRDRDFRERSPTTPFGEVVHCRPFSESATPPPSAVSRAVNRIGRSDKRSER